MNRSSLVPPLSPGEQNRLWMRRGFVAGLLLLGFAATCLLDRTAYHALRIDGWSAGLGTKDWAQMLRAGGYWPVWLIAGLMIDLAASATQRERVRKLGARLLLSAAAGGLLAEMMKVIIRRHRPSVTNDGQHVFDWFSPTVDGRGLGLASSHAGVAFGAAFVLWRWSPRAGVVAMLLALGCSMTRLWAGAHFVSDVYAAAVLAWVGARVVWSMVERMTLDGNNPAK